MAYVPDWEALSRSLARLRNLTDLHEDQIKRDLCNAISDQKITVRIAVSEDDGSLPGACLSGKEVGVPAQLEPLDFDWGASLPTKDWYAGDPNDVNIGWETRKASVVELRIGDVDAVFSSANADFKLAIEGPPIEPYMIEPMTLPESAGYVPLCCALFWIMTNGAATQKNLQDTGAWEAALSRLLPLLSTGEIEVVGRPADRGAPERIEGSMFAGISVAEPLRESIDFLVGDDPWISVSPYLDKQHWDRGFNDQLFLRSASPAAWTHLQVKKGDVLRWIVFEKPVAHRPAKPRKRRGAAQKYDWDDAKQFVLKQLNNHGDFDQPENRCEGWRSQNDLVRKLQEYMGSRRGGECEPSDSSAKSFVRAVVHEWRAANNSASRITGHC